MTFSETLTSARKRRGWSKEELAARIQVSRQAVSKWETGAAMPDVALIPAIAAFFNVSTDELFDFNPTAENLARWIAERVPNCYKVTFQESEGNVACYVKPGFEHVTF